MPSFSGRHELGQNFLVNHQVISTIVDAVARTGGPIVEIGPGDGAITFPLERLGRPVTAVEIDARRAHRLSTRVGPATEVVTQDFLTYRLPAQTHTLVGNLPFHITTAILRRLLNAPGWTEAVLVVQWEVARRRAGVGGATMMTAQWWPWFDFGLVSRVSAQAFRPMPNVDGGILTMSRRNSPLVSASHRKRYQAFVRAVFTGRGQGLPQIVSRAPAPGTHGGVAPQQVSHWMARSGVNRQALPKDLTAEQWAELFHLCLGRERPTAPDQGESRSKTQHSDGPQPKQRAAPGRERAWPEQQRRNKKKSRRQSARRRSGGATLLDTRTARSLRE